MNELVEEINDLPSVAEEAAREYFDRRNIMKNRVDEMMANKENIDELIGFNPLKMMFDNHENHVLFMSSVFMFNDYRLLTDNISRIYSSFRRKGFSFSYFPEEFSCWIEAVREYMSGEKNQAIIEIYRWLMNKHEDFVTAAQKYKEHSLQLDGEWRPVYHRFLDALLLKEDVDCREVMDEHISSPGDYEQFAENVIKPSLYTVGVMWEQGNINVAEEHRAASKISRLLSSYNVKFFPRNHDKGSAVISAVANEFHEIGARMVADFLEFDGWDVSFLGADIPREELIDYLKNDTPFLLGLSAALPQNMIFLKATVEEIRNTSEIEGLNILAGGKVLNDFPYLRDELDIDACAENGREAVKIANKWLNN